MELFGIEKLSLVDYDGFVASTVFTGTCNFKCGFCHNSPLVLDVKNLQQIDVEKDVFEYLQKRKGIIEGVCITGGEPTLQKDLPSFCERLKKTGLSVKVDTNGTNPDMIKLLAENGLADYFAMDIKNDKEHYAKIIGFDKYDTSNVEKTVNFFMSNDYGYEFRTTLIYEYHKLDNIIGIGKWITGARKYFMQKFKQVDTCISSDLHGVNEKEAEIFLSEIQKFIPSTKLRGYDI